MSVVITVAICLTLMAFNLMFRRFADSKKPKLTRRLLTRTTRNRSHLKLLDGGRRDRF